MKHFVLCTVFLLCFLWSVQGKSMRVLWQVPQPSIQYRTCRFGSSANHVVTDIGHKGNIQVYSEGGERVWAAPMDAMSSPQLATSQTNFFGSIINIQEQQVLNFWNYKNNTPTLSARLPSNAAPSPTNSLVFSGDGTKLFETLLQDSCTKIIWKDLRTGREKNWSSEIGLIPLNTATTKDGEVVAVLTIGKFVIIDTATGAVLYEEPATPAVGAPNTILCVSTTGQYVAYGYGSTVILHSFHDWSKHVKTWTYTEVNMAIQSCAIAESNLVLTFYSSGYEMLTKVVAFDLHTHSDPAWTWTSPPGDPSNYPSQTVITEDGDFFAISSWGTIYGNTPQVVVWTTFDSNPIATFIAKGSLYDIQLSYKNHQEKFLDSRKTAKRAPSDLLVLTCGKVGHKTVYGTDGELYLLDLDMH